MTKLKVIFVALFALGLCFGLSARQVEAQEEFKPVLIFCTPDGNTALKALRDITTRAGFPHAADSIESALNSIEELDKTKPKGIVILSDGEQFQGYAFGPISDFQAFPFIDMLDIEDEGDGSFTLALPVGAPLYIKQEKEWVFLSLFPLPENLPSDPSVYFQGLDQEYLTALKINVSDLPQETCLNYLDLARIMVGAFAQRQTDEANFQFIIDQYEQMLMEVDTFLYAWKLDPKTNDFVVKSEVVFRPDAQLAKNITETSKLQSQFSGFFRQDGVLLSLFGCSLIPELQKEWISTLYGSYLRDFRESLNEGTVGELNESELTLANELIDNFEAVLLGSIESGKMDLGFSLFDTGTLLAGMSLVEGDKVSDSIKRLVEIMPEEYKHRVKLNAAQYKGYDLSSFVLPLSESGCPELPPSLENETLTVLVGVKSDAVCLAAGLDKNVADELKKAIDDSLANPVVPETYFVMAPYAIAKLANRFGLLELPEMPEMAIEIIEILGRCPQDARYVVSQAFGPNSYKMVGVVDAAILPTIGEIVKVVMENLQADRELDFDPLDFDVDDDSEE